MSGAALEATVVVPHGAVADLARRWALARRSALLAAQARDAGVEQVTIQEGVAGEEAALAGLTADGLEHALGLVFDYSRLLGGGFVRHHRLGLELADLPELLPALEVPCFAGRWVEASTEGDLLLRRLGCRGERSRRACDYWREAGDGLVLGLTDGAIRHRRHRSFGHQDSECVDLLLARPDSPHRFGEIPEEMRLVLDTLLARLARLAPGVRVELVGLSEATLCFRCFERPEGLAVDAMLRQLVARRFPQLTLLDLSPRPVLGPE